VSQRNKVWEIAASKLKLDDAWTASRLPKIISRFCSVLLGLDNTKFDLTAKLCKMLLFEAGGKLQRRKEPTEAGGKLQRRKEPAESRARS